MAFTEVTVTGTFLANDGVTPAAGTVTFALTHPLQDPATGQVVARSPKTVTLDSDGSFSVALVATDDTAIAPAGVSYQVKEKITGAPLRAYRIVLPVADLTVDLAALVPIHADDLYQYVLTPRSIDGGTFSTTYLAAQAIDGGSI